MSNPDLKTLEDIISFLNHCSPVSPTNCSIGLEIADDGAPWLGVLISVVYFLVATTGVLGNLLVMFLLYSTHTITTGTINFYVFNLALADLMLSLALPFWAIDIAMDYSWPFGVVACKAVSLLTGLNVFASCFFLTAMSLTRYCFVTTALKPNASLCNRSCTFPITTAFIWTGALVAAVPRAVFADLKYVSDANDTVCLLLFPDGTAWLGINQLLRVLLGFLLPCTTIILSYLLLLRFLCRHKLKGSRSLRKADISKSVAVVVLSFCACWFPYNVITFWSILINLNIVDMSRSYYLAQKYFFPLANCLAFASSCFNPVIYCLIRKEYRVALHNMFLKLNIAIMSKIPYGINYTEPSGQDVPLNNDPNSSRTWEKLTNHANCYTTLNKRKTG
uniref:Relaxin-3 receptor 1-like n=1 Tax=Sphaeramia orbicularis TaxID=375764 RepID=A0A672YBP8_9TELE